MHVTFGGRRRLVLMAAVAATLLASVPAAADWDPGDPHKMHYPQLPDLGPEGLSVGATDPLTVADDWRCSATGPVAGIHLWAAWLDDAIPGGGAGDLTFALAIYADIPARPGQHSRPGTKLWSMEFNPGEFQTRPYAGGVVGQFLDPAAGMVIGAYTQVWQYNFFPQNPFIQQVDTVYWLGVQALPSDPLSQLGWLSSGSPHFLDDSVWTTTPTFGGPPGSWSEIRYPIGHPRQGESVDQAFVMAPEPSGLVLLGLGGLSLVLLTRRTRRTTAGA